MDQNGWLLVFLLIVVLYVSQNRREGYPGIGVVKGTGNTACKYVECSSGVKTRTTSGRS
jgi:hypothetical protein